MEFIRRQVGERQRKREIDGDTEFGGQRQRGRIVLGQMMTENLENRRKEQKTSITRMSPARSPVDFRRLKSEVDVSYLLGDFIQVDGFLLHQGRLGAIEQVNIKETLGGLALRTRCIRRWSHRLVQQKNSERFC